MKVEVFTFCWNEMEIIPFAVDYWREYATKVTVFDNGSTDGSADYLKKFDFIDVVPFDMGGGMDDILFIEKKNNCWKGSDADYVIVCDMDEMVFAPHIKKSLATMKRNGITICEPIQYTMISDRYPEYIEGLLMHETSRRYFKSQSKAVLFDPKEIKEMNYTPGAHTCEPVGNVVWGNDGVYMLHVDHNLSIEYKLEKYKKLDARRSKRNVEMKLGIHYAFDEKTITDWYNERMKESVDINDVWER